MALTVLTAFSVHETAQAREQAARAQRVSDFVKNTFLSASSTWTSPLRGQSRAIEFNDVLENAAERVGRELGNDPVAQADLLGTIGGTYSVLGNPVKGEALLRQALALLQRTGRDPGARRPILAYICATLTHFRAVTGKRSRHAIADWRWLEFTDPN